MAIPVTFEFFFRQKRVGGTENIIDEFIMNGVEISDTLRATANWSALNTACANLLTAQGLAGATVVATALVPGVQYEIVTAGTTDFTLVGAADSTVGTMFVASGVGLGTGTARNFAGGTGNGITGIGRIVGSAAVLDEVYRDAIKVITSTAAIKSALTAPFTTLGLL